MGEEGEMKMGMVIAKFLFERSDVLDGHCILHVLTILVV